MKNLKDYFKMIVTAVVCFVMNIVLKKDKKAVRSITSRPNNILEELGFRFAETVEKLKVDYIYLLKDEETKEKPFEKDRIKQRDYRKNKIIYWDEPRIQNKISKFVYFNTG